MKTLFRFFIVSFLLVLLCLAVGSSPAFAQTNTHAYSYSPQPLHSTVTTTYLLRSFHGGYYFSPTYIYCWVYRPCVIIVNRTGRTVMILDNNQSIVSNLWNGRSTGAITFYSPGTRYYTDAQQNIRVPLTVSVYGNYYRGGPACQYDCLKWWYRS